VKHDRDKQTTRTMKRIDLIKKLQKCTSDEVILYDDKLSKSIIGERDAAREITDVDDGSALLPVAAEKQTKKTVTRIKF